jgi:hypothetical protein
VFVSFDYDHDQDLKTLLVGQSRNANSPFEVEDWSVKEESATWRAEARSRIRRIVICGLHTHTASGVAAEVAMARAEKVNFALLRGRKDGWPRRPRGTSWYFDEIHPWKWEVLERLTQVRR